MTKMTKVALSIITLVSVGSVSVNADIAKGQKLYLKKLKAVCGMNGADMAAKHTMSEWESIHEQGKIGKEIKSVCPKVKDSSIKESLLPHYFDFFKEYAKDSGNIPAC